MLVCLNTYIACIMCVCVCVYIACVCVCIYMFACVCEYVCIYGFAHMQALPKITKRDDFGIYASIACVHIVSVT